jgi:phospholipid/cholesterol/gamma-HCH transport system ATP-binding protein
MTFQRSGLFDSLTCGENLAFALREVRHLAVRELAPRVAQALSEVGLGGQENLRVHEMSGGMQKRLGIARALLLSPRVILYDEPTAGLDPLTAHAINDLIDDVRKKYAMSLVLVTSDPRQAYRLCDHLGFLYRGRFLAQGTMAQMHDSKEPAVRQFLRGEAKGPLTEGIGIA